MLGTLIIQKRRRRREAGRGGKGSAGPPSEESSALRLPSMAAGPPQGAPHSPSADAAEAAAYALRAEASLAGESSNGSVSSWDAAKPLWAMAQGASRSRSKGKEHLSVASHQSGGSGSSATVALVRGEVRQAVTALQGALQAELHEDELQLYDVLGRGGFGTVYHGAIRLV